MFEQSPKEEILHIIKEIEINPASTQRTLSERLGISLGKTNYLIKALIKKGIIEVKNFSHNSGKMGKIHYILTKSGFKHKVELIYHFLEKKEREHMLLKQECEKLNAKGNNLVL
jgi:EPS-associated MarR family transcriptional regulator